jgi:hypothetical protein
VRGWRHVTKRSPFLTCSIAWPRANRWACALRYCAYPFPALVARRIELRRVAHRLTTRTSGSQRPPGGTPKQTRTTHAWLARQRASQSHLSHRPAAKGWFLVAGR